MNVVLGVDLARLYTVLLLSPFILSYAAGFYFSDDFPKTAFTRRSVA